MGNMMAKNSGKIKGKVKVRNTNKWILWQENNGKRGKKYKIIVTNIPVPLLY